MNVITKTLTIFAIALLMTSCYTYTYNVGDGPQTGVEVEEKNHYVVYGLVPLSISNPTEMAGDTEDYAVKIEHTFIDGLINALTGGIYSPTTTVVTR